ncbi:MAG: hypothetical protein SFV15_16670 [Polyangiaceae bacterium]|nr:hypothetical protein [Polyangiaceae bacterium]
MEFLSLFHTVAATTPDVIVPILPNTVWDSMCKSSDWTSGDLSSPMNVLRITLLVLTGLVFLSAERARRREDYDNAQIQKWLGVGLGVIAGIALFVAPESVFDVVNKQLCAKDKFELFLLRVRVGLPVTAAVLLILAERARRLGTKVPRATQKRVAIVFSIIAFFAYFDFFNPSTRYREYYHRHEFYHYYLGSKYFKEINYSLLYECTLVAEVDLGRREAVAKRELRDLTRANLITPVSKSRVLSNPDFCKKNFTPERWEAWKQDVDWFQRSAAGEYWENMQKDHGYNPPPVWTMAGKFFADLAPASDRFFKLLSLLDVGFHLGIVLMLGWAFGFRVMAIATVWWGCNSPANFYWTGGAFMRQDWIFLLVASVCLAKKQKFALSGAALTWSALLRIFPGILFAGWIALIASYIFQQIIKQRRSGGPINISTLLHSSHKRLIVGCAVAGAILIPASMVSAGTQSYSDFVHHIAVHKSTPLTNHMGLETILSHNWEGRMRFARDDNRDDPFEGWKDGRLERFDRMKPLAFAIIGLCVFSIWWALKRTRLLWVAPALSVPLVVCLLNLTCYYYSMFILVAVLARQRPQLMPVFLAVSGASQILLSEYYWFDDKFNAISWLFLIFSFLLLISYCRPFSAARLKAWLQGKPEPRRLAAPQPSAPPEAIKQQA